MSLKSNAGKLMITCATFLFLASPVLAGTTTAGKGADQGIRPLDASAMNMLLAGKGNGKGYGPGDGSGNGGSGPKDGSGNGPGDCTTAVYSVDTERAVARGGNGNGGNGNGGNGPGDGTGNGGNGPGDGTGNGPGTGTCIAS